MIFFSACEASADLHAGMLMEALTRHLPGVRYTGIGGERMIKAGLSPVMHARELSVMGLVEVLGRMATIRSAFGAASRAFASGRVDLAVLVDAPDFNLRLAARAKRAGVPVVYFISPKVWAWRKGRLNTIRRVVDRMMLILPFEQKIYDAAGVPATYVGNPLVDEAAEALRRAPDGKRWRPADFALDNTRPVVALLPGSRPGEVEHALSGLLGAARLLADRLPGVQFLMPVADGLDGADVRRRVLAAGVPVTCVDGNALPVLSAATVAAVCSGTATLQTALADCPSLIVYRTHPLTFWVGRKLVPMPEVGLVNLVAGRRIVEEYLQNDFTPQVVADHLYRLLTDPDEAPAQRMELAAVRQKLGAPGAPEKAAGVVADMLKEAA